MTFEEKFPSLKGWRLVVYTWPDGYCMDVDEEGNYLNVDIVEVRCLDKQRVREVIQALRDLSEGWISGGCDAEYCMKCFDDKVKELGL